MILPKYLKKGDKIAIVSPAGPVDPDLVDGACARLHKWGFVPQVGFTAKGKSGRFSAPDEDRLADLQQAMDDPSVSAILCAASRTDAWDETGGLCDPVYVHH